MYFNRRIALLFLTLSMLGLGQSTVAQPENPTKSNPSSESECPGGISEQFKLGGQVVNPKTFTLSQLQALPSSQVTVSFLTGKGAQTHTYVGVTLWTLIQAAGGLKPNPDPTVKNGFLRQYVTIDATDCYKVVLSEGEIDPKFEAKQVLVAYATNDVPLQGPQLLGDEGIALLVVPGDFSGGRYVSNIRRIQVRSAQ